MSKKLIGFKNENKETENDNESTESSAVVKIDPKIEEAIENRINNQHEFQEHMIEHEKLVEENTKYKKYFKIGTTIILLIIFGYLCYLKGAKAQAVGNGPYETYRINGKTVVVHN